MMKILFLVPYVPNRVRVRPFQLLRQLARRGHDVTLVTAWSDESERRDLEEIRPLCGRVEAVHLPRLRSWINCLGAVPSSVPLQAVYSWHAGLAQQARRLASDVDVVHVEHLRGSAYALFLRKALAGETRPVPIVWDSVDCISLLFERARGYGGRSPGDLLRSFEIGRTGRFEGRLVGAFDRTLATSPDDARALTALADGSGRPPVTVLPQGVDLDYFHQPVGEDREPETLVMTGKMSYHANVAMAVSFVQGVLPAIRRRLPGVRLWLVGKDPTHEVRALADQHGVIVTGTVPDLRPYLQQASVALAPVAYAVGIQNKVLEAMACGTPVVASPQAITALEGVSGREVVVAEGPSAMAEAVVDLVKDPARRARLGAASRSYVERHHDWSRVGSRLEEIYDEAIRSRN